MTLSGVKARSSFTARAAARIGCAAGRRRPSARLYRRRPQTESRTLFLRVRAPAGPLPVSGVTHVVSGTCVRAGLPPVGAHRLRHTAATGMLRAGASLPEIAQVLRHRQLKTTALYDRPPVLPAADSRRWAWKGAGTAHDPVHMTSGTLMRSGRCLAGIAQARRWSASCRCSPRSSGIRTRARATGISKRRRS